MPELFHHLPANGIRVFTGRNFLCHLLAIVLTCLIVESGLDWDYYRSTRYDWIAKLAFPAIVLGSFVPILGTLGVLIFGLIRRNQRLISLGWALGQSALLGYLVSIAYKTWTGRIPPPFRGFRMSAQNLNSLTDTSHGFQIGFMKGGIFWGWPSSHATIAFSMSVCFIALFPKSRPVLIWAAAYAFYVGLSVSVSIHWLSEFVAGAIVGSVIGRVVGNSFRRKLV